MNLDTREHRNKVIVCLAACPLGIDALLAAFRRMVFPQFPDRDFWAFVDAMERDGEVVPEGLRVRLPWQAP